MDDETAFCEVAPKRTKYLIKRESVTVIAVFFHIGLGRSCINLLLVWMLMGSSHIGQPLTAIVCTFQAYGLLGEASLLSLLRNYAAICLL